MSSIFEAESLDDDGSGSSVESTLPFFTAVDLDDNGPSSSAQNLAADETARASVMVVARWS